MATGFTIIADTFKFVTDIIHTSIGENVIALSTPLSIVFIAALYLYMVYVAYTWFSSHQVDLLKDGIKHLLALAVIITIALNSQYYINNIVPIVLNLGSELGAKVTHSGGADSSLDKFITTVYFTAKQIYSSSDGVVGTLIALLYMILIGVTAIPFVVTSFAILLTAKIMVALLLSIGTIFIAFAMFPTTRPWFQQWIGMCWNYTLITLLFPIALVLEIKVINTFVFKDGVLQSDLTSLIKLALVLLAFNIISVQIPVLASSLSGGIGINGMSSTMGTMIGNPLSKMMNTGKGAVNVGKGSITAGKGATSAYKYLRGKFGNNIKA